MNASTHEWQREDNRGFGPWLLRVFLLGWAAIIPYCLIYWSPGWLLWSVTCVSAGIVMIARERRRRREEIAGLGIAIHPSEVGFGEWIAVRLQLSAEVARTIRWWRTSIAHGRSVQESDAYEVATESEFAVDPSGEQEPVSELDMVIVFPERNAVTDRDSLGEAWFLLVVIETDRGRLMSSRIPLQVRR